MEIFFEGWIFFRMNKFQEWIFLSGHRSSHSLNIWLLPNILGLVVSLFTEHCILVVFFQWAPEEKSWQEVNCNTSSSSNLCRRRLRWNLGGNWSKACTVEETFICQRECELGLYSHFSNNKHSVFNFNIFSSLHLSCLLYSNCLTFTVYTALATFSEFMQYCWHKSKRD